MMHFDENGKYVKFDTMLNNHVDPKTSYLSDNSNRICKSKCLQYKATKPVNSGRYANGQVRCQTCEIFMTEDGAANGYCLCCNMRVRSKPRNKMYKEILRNKEENKSENFTDSPLDPEQNSYVSEPPLNNHEKVSPKIENTDKFRNCIRCNAKTILLWDNRPLCRNCVVNKKIQNTDDNNSNEKKSAPVYEEIDESVKTYYELKDFLENELRPQANYQFVMLHELLIYSKLHKGEIAESLAYFNNKNTTDIDAVKYYFNVPVFDVLVNHGFVNKHEPLTHQVSLPHYSLNVKLEEMQKIQLLEYLSNEIKKYNQEHDIPENEFPESNNAENFIWKQMYGNSSVPSNINIELDKESTRDSYVPKFPSVYKKFHPTPSKWIWSVTPENWEILRSQNIWGSRISKERIGKKVKSGDQVAFYVIGTSSFKGIFEFVGNWYDSPGKTWNDDLRPDGSLIHISQIQIKPLQLGSVKIHSLHEKLELFIDKSQSNRNSVLQGGNGYPSNNSRPLSDDDFTIIRTELMRNRIDLSENSSSVEEKTENTIISTPVSEVADTKIFKFNNSELNIQNCKVLSTDTIKKDQILTNDEIMNIFKVGNMGGIRYTKQNNVIVLLSTQSDDYDDSIDLTSGFIIYTGEGKGDQEIKNGNEKILNSQNTPMVYFKEVYQEPGSRPRGVLDNKYKFIGVVKYHKYNWATEKGRKVIKFVLEIIS